MSLLRISQSQSWTSVAPVACFCWVPATDHVRNDPHHIIWPVSKFVTLDMWIWGPYCSQLLWHGLDVRYTEGTTHGAWGFFFPQHECRRNDFTSLNCFNTKAKFSVCLPAGLWAWAEGTNPLFWSYTSFSFLFRFQILSALWNRSTPIRHTCDWSLGSAPANDNWCVIDAFHAVLRRCIRSCLKEQHRSVASVRMQRYQMSRANKNSFQSAATPTHTYLSSVK